MCSIDTAGRTSVRLLSIIGVVIGVVVALVTSDVILGVIAGSAFIAITLGLLRLWTGAAGTGERRT